MEEENFETAYSDEALIHLYNQVRMGNRTWPTNIWTSPYALKYAMTIIDYWVHNIMGWKTLNEAEAKYRPSLLEKHKVAEPVNIVLEPVFGSDWLSLEMLLSESMALYENRGWAKNITEPGERLEAAFNQVFRDIYGDPDVSETAMEKFNRFKGHLLRLWGALEKAEELEGIAREQAAYGFWQDKAIYREVRTRQSEVWFITTIDEQGEQGYIGEVNIHLDEEAPYCCIVLDQSLPPQSWRHVIWKCEHDLLGAAAVNAVYSVWHGKFVGEYYRCSECGELHPVNGDDFDSGELDNFDDLD
jgi:hypothetical protein